MGSASLARCGLRSPGRAGGGGVTSHRAEERAEKAAFPQFAERHERCTVVVLVRTT